MRGDESSEGQPGPDLWFVKPMDRRKFVSKAALAAGVIGAGSAFGGARASASTRAASQPQAGGTLVFGNELATLPDLNTNAANGNGFAGLRAVQHVFEGLLGWDFYSGGVAGTKGVPALATSWTHNADNTVWTFKLRQGVKFHDGTPFDADAVIWNFDRMWNKKSPQFDSLVGTLASLWCQKVKSYRKVDPKTIEVTLSAPRPLDQQIQYALIASPSAVKKYGKDFSKNPVGTGPFIFDGIQGQSIHYKANPDYWNKGTPRIDKLVYQPIPDSSARVAALLSGQVNFAAPIQPDDIARVKAAGFKVSQAPYPQYWTWWFNTHTGPFANKLVRQAANYAVDKESMIKNLLKGTAILASQPAPPYSPLYDKKLGVIYKYNPAKAKALLKQAGFANGVKVTVHVPTSGSGMMNPVPMSEFMQSNLRDVGIDVSIKTWEWGSFVQNVLVTQKKPAWDAFCLGHAFLDRSWYWTNYATEAWAPAGWNMNLYSNKTVDKLSEQILETGDEAKIRSLAHRLNRTIMEDAPNLYVCHDTNPKAYSSKVKGFVDSHSWAFTIPFERVSAG